MCPVLWGGMMFDLRTIERHRGGDAEWWEQAFGVRDVRAGLYSAFAEVLRFPERVPAHAIGTVANACVALNPSSEGARICGTVCERAISWVTNVPDSTSLAADHIRIFGGFGLPGAVHCFVALPDGHAPAAQSVERVADAYRRMGYWAEDTGQHPLCPAHVTNAFGFMAHCLLLGDLGVEEGSAEAERFYDGFLRDWLPGFADTVVREAGHPVTEMVGVVLGGFARYEAARGS